MTAGQAHAGKQVAATLEAVRLPNGKGRPTGRPRQRAGDQTYSYPRVRAYMRRRGSGPRSSPRAGTSAPTCALTRKPPESATSSNAAWTGSRGPGCRRSELTPTHQRKENPATSSGVAGFSESSVFADSRFLRELCRGINQD